MDAKVHRAILKYAVGRAKKRLHDTGKHAVVDLESAFWALHQGNWLADMNQATCFFDLVEGRDDPYSVLNFAKSEYNLPKAVREHPGEWTQMFGELWTHECMNSGLPGLLPADHANVEQLTPQIIGGYYPMDHFDVVDSTDVNGNVVSSREVTEFVDVNKHRMTYTAHFGVFGYTLDYWLRPILTTGEKRDRPYALRSIGHATHILQDFFGHSNFVELLLKIAAARGMLDEGLANALSAETAGTFGAFWQADAECPEATPVMTGRFDHIDTVASILGIYRGGLVRGWSDLGASGLGGTHAAAHDLLFEVIFGTFSNRPYVDSARKVVSGLMNINERFRDLQSRATKGVIRILAGILGRIGGPKAKSSIDEVKELVVAIDTEELARYTKAGRILYFEHLIEGQLRAKLANVSNPQLPHHTLLAKDRDVAHPEVRLAYKLGCILATEVTAELLYHYASGASVGAMSDLLDRYYRHPELYLELPGVPERLKRLTNELYGRRWPDSAMSANTLL